MNWTVIILVGLVLAILVIFLILRNLKDERDFEQTINRDDSRKPKEMDAEADDAEAMH
ncbi:MAG: hypothetical protein IPP72_16025 [Chitinophagaceae bacterium]|nr:hypothetical protein [Chitinophagaceae bacterium]